MFGLCIDQMHLQMKGNYQDISILHILQIPYIFTRTQAHVRLPNENGKNDRIYSWHITG